MSSVIKSANRPKTTSTSRPELTGWQIVSGADIVLPFVPTKEQAEKCVGIFNDVVTTGWRPKGQRRKPLAKMHPVVLPDATKTRLAALQVFILVNTCWHGYGWKGHAGGWKGHAGALPTSALDLPPVLTAGEMTVGAHHEWEDSAPDQTFNSRGEALAAAAAYNAERFHERDGQLYGSWLVVAQFGKEAAPVFNRQIDTSTGKGEWTHTQTVTLKLVRPTAAELARYPLVDEPIWEVVLVHKGGIEEVLASGKTGAQAAARAEGVRAGMGEGVKVKVRKMEPAHA